MANNPAYEYNFELETMMHQFAALIDDAICLRYKVNKDTKQREFVKVVQPQYVWGLKQRTIYDIVNKAKNFILPTVAITITGIRADKERLAAKFDKIRQKVNQRNYAYKRPTPIVMSVDVTIITKYRSDLFQIYGKLCTQFQPYCTYSWYVPHTENTPKEEWEELKNKVEWDFNLDIDFNGELKETQETRFSGKMHFDIEGWIFPQMKGEHEGIIYDIGLSHPMRQELLDRFLDEDRVQAMLVDQAIKQEVVDKYNNPRELNTAHPQIVNVYREAVTATKSLFFLMDKHRTFPFRMEEDSYLTLDGYNFEYADVLFVPQDTTNFFSSKLERVDLDFMETDLFPEKDTVEPKKNTVYGYKLNVNHRTRNTLTVNFGGINYKGNFDIVVVNCRDYDTVSNCIGTKLHTKNSQPPANQDK